MGVVGDLLGGRAERKAAKNAANAQIDAANQANALEKQMYEQSRADQMPWLEQGKASLSQLAGLTKPDGELMRTYSAADFQADPGYQFRLNEATKGADRAMAARGLTNSGTALRELSRVNQGMASDEFQNAYNRWMQQRLNQYNMLSGLANTGQVTGGQLADLGSNYSNQYGQNLGQAANARASSFVAGGRSKAQGFRSIDDNMEKIMSVYSKIPGFGMGD